jgi:hypothetical protein
MICFGAGGCRGGGRIPGKPARRWPGRSRPRREVAWHHDGAAKGSKPIGFGNCWVVAGIVAQLAFLSRPVCLPVLARLWRPRHTGKIAYARVLAELIAAPSRPRTALTAPAWTRGRPMWAAGQIPLGPPRGGIWCPGPLLLVSVRWFSLW